MTSVDMLSLTTTRKLVHGGHIPIFGLGVWESSTKLCAKTCETALRNGYRQIDTAQMYRNEKEVGEGVKASDVAREDIFITTKTGPGGGSVDSIYTKCKHSVDLLGGYADLFLVHWPSSDASNKSTWLALEKLHKEGKAKAIGVSNFSQKQIEDMRSYATVWPPAVNQLELHPWQQQRSTVEYCKIQGIVLQAYCPIVRMKKDKSPDLQRIAKATGKSTVQVLLRYSVQKDWVPLPKSDKEHRIQSNAAIFDFELSEKDMKILDRREEEDGSVDA